ncbi:MAG: phosphoribosyl-ATP diphosphatase [Rhizobiales bacterium]|nr:phosphoribosyl-ATP diphosphatase [Hyphomicrobiales bacterium]
MGAEVLVSLAATIKARRGEDASLSYTAKLLAAGPARCARKLGEEAVELLVAALSEDDEHVKAEAADLLYHLLVLLEARNIPLSDVLDVLAARAGTSGIAEKAARKASE